MAPPIRVSSRADIERRYRAIKTPENYQCLLYLITQHECTFSSGEANTPEIICLPFKRLFQRCLVPHVIHNDGVVRKEKRWINIEITDVETNRDIVTDPKYARDVDDFRNAERDFRRKMWREVADSD